MTNTGLRITYESEFSHILPSNSSPFLYLLLFTYFNSFQMSLVIDGNVLSTSDVLTRVSAQMVKDPTLRTACVLTLSLICIAAIGSTCPEFKASLHSPNMRNLLGNDDDGELLAIAKAELEAQRHKDLLPMDNNDIIGTSLVSLGLMIAASGGIGGGGILVPLLILVFNFHPKFAIPLSNFTILGASIMNMVLNTFKRHPDADRPLVDWDLILIMEPLTMAGAVVGALIGKVLPDWILVLSLVILLAQTTYVTLEKAISQYRKETVEIEKQRKSELAKAVDEEIELTDQAETVGLLHSEKGNKESGNLISNEKGIAPVISLEEKELIEILNDEKNVSVHKVTWLTIMVFGVLALNLFKGGGSAFPSPFGIECGTGAYWGMTCLVFVWILAFSIFIRQYLIDRWRLKSRVGYKYIKGDIEWNERNTIVFPCICFFAGFFAGMFGVGGGIVKGPLMLQMGVHPLVASGTVAVMIMFTSVSATTMFLAFGTLTWDYAWFLFVVGIVSTVIGQFGVSFLVDKYKRYSFISFSIGAVVAISTVLMALQSIFSLVDAQSNQGGGDSGQSSRICPR